MIRFILMIMLFFSSLILIAQSTPEKYWIQFTDKSNNPFSINNPQAYLSQRSIERRNKQNISIDIKDLPITPSYIDSVIAKGAKVCNRSKWFNAITIQNDDTTITDSALVASIYSLGFVNKVDTVLYLKSGHKYSVEEYLGKYLSAELDYGASFNHINMVSGNRLHKLGYTGKDMIIAVLDNGFRGTNTIAAFDSLWIQNRIFQGPDYVDGDDSVFDVGGHGTNVLSVMAANVPGEYIGTAPHATYWLMKTEAPYESRVEEDNWVAAAEFADSIGADLINSSLGYNTFDNSSMNYPFSAMDGNTTRITRGADIAASKGILVVNSAGNEGNNSWGKVLAPADGDSVFSIGAVNGAGNYASFSSRGPTADGRIKPNVVAQGQSTFLYSISGGLGTSNGTSFSAPLIAGMTACLWQAHPEKNNMEIINAIQQSASQSTEPDERLGYGIPDYFCAHFLLFDSNCNIVSLIDSSYFPMPNAFIPSSASGFNDAINSKFGILQPNLIEELHFFNIYNRWSELVYTSRDHNQAWDGYFKGEIAFEGVYLYQISYLGVDGNENFVQGAVSLLR